MKKDSYSILDLFAGCGGLSKGMEKAGFTVIAANEFWEPAQETYVRNHPGTAFFGGDITSSTTKKSILDFFKGDGCDVIVGGPPCQAYSMAGLRDPNDPRGRLFEDYVEIVDKLRPKVFVMENVKGILTMKHNKDDLSEREKGDFEPLRRLEKERAELLLLRKQSRNNPERFKFGHFEEKRLEVVKKEIIAQERKVEKYRELVTDQILRRFKEIGYSVKFKLLNAANYGVPQKRERVVFIGTRYDVPIIFPEPTHSRDGQLTLNGRLRPWLTVREAIDDLKDRKEDRDFNHVITNHDTEFLQKLKNTPIGESVFGGYSDAFFRNSPEEPARTVKENHGGVLVHYEKNRVMTPRELARLQSFPDDFVFLGSKSTILKQIGNAVPPGLGEAVGNAVRKILDRIERLESKNNDISGETFVKIPVYTHSMNTT